MQPVARIYFCVPSLILAQSKEKIIIIITISPTIITSTIISLTFNLLIQYCTNELNLIDLLTALQTNFSLYHNTARKHLLTTLTVKNRVRRFVYTN